MNVYQAKLLWREFLMSAGAAKTVSAIAGEGAENLHPAGFLQEWANAFNGTSAPLVQPSTPAKAGGPSAAEEAAARPSNTPLLDVEWPKNAPWTQPVGWKKGKWTENHKRRWLAQQGTSREEVLKLGVRGSKAAPAINVPDHRVYHAGIADYPPYAQTPPPNEWFIRWGGVFCVRRAHLDDLRAYLESIGATK